MNEIKFRRDTSFRKQFFVPDSFAHPAKMDAHLLIWIVEKYTEAGETILDPMAGSGTTMLACGLGRNVILVELEEKFCKMIADNWEEVRMRPQLGYSMGECQIIQGDARRLEGLVDKIVTSPPYAEQERDRKDTAKELSDGVFKRRSYRLGDAYSDNPDNIGNLPYGEIDKCIFSPPHADSLTKGGVDKSGERLQAKIDKGLVPPETARALTKGSMVVNPRYSNSDDNIGNLPYGQIDKIVTSPPYEGSNITGQSDSYQGKHGPYSQVQLKDYRESKGNIGNLKSESYLEAMLQVYAQCHAVLKPQGLMILVTKNFIRNKQVVRLDEDTIKLCEQAGFSYLERHYRKLPSQSFWRVIYHQKHPEVEQILYEDVLVFTR